MERRAFQIEVRAAQGNPRRLEGFAATFDSEARVGDFIEVIRPGAFKATLASGADILALCDHDPTRVLGRTRSGTLRLTENQRGLAFEIDVPDTTLGRDVLALAERGDTGGMSFGFRAVDEFWSGNRRELRAVELREISVVSAWPAYSNTSIEARAKIDDQAPDAGLRRALGRWRA
jgi:HK97 family phage prohead protease